MNAARVYALAISSAVVAVAPLVAIAKAPSPRLIVPGSFQKSPSFFVADNIDLSGQCKRPRGYFFTSIHWVSVPRFTLFSTIELAETGPLRIFPRNLSANESS